MKKGFTLIELLVVVVIIAVLAAIGIPMYQGSVAKSVAGEMIKMTQTIMAAERQFRADTGRYSINPEALNISLSNTTTVALTNGARRNMRDFDVLIESTGTLNSTNNTTTAIRINTRTKNDTLRIYIFSEAPQHTFCVGANAEMQNACRNATGNANNLTVAPAGITPGQMALMISFGTVFLMA